MALTARGEALRWLTKHRGITEDPPGSNSDRRDDGIRAAQMRLGAWLVGQAWCGVWAASALLAGGVRGVTWRLASVSLIEDDARAGRAPFRSWIARPAKTGGHWRHVYRGDLVVLFGRGVHVETLRSAALPYRLLGYVRTEGGNTSSGDSGSQSNGGGAFARRRRIADIHGIARVNFRS